MDLVVTVSKLRFWGNPRMHSCWFDEAMNKHLARVCRSAHSHDFKKTVLLPIASAYGGDDANFECSKRRRRSIRVE